MVSSYWIIMRVELERIWKYFLTLITEANETHYFSILFW